VSKGRLEAFSDGVIAIIITIMVLELRPPETPEWAALRPVMPIFFSYLTSFLYLGIYWNNHHHLLQAAHRVSGAVLWANLHLLFWLSLTPFVTAWAGQTHFASAPVAAYGVVLLLDGAAFTLLVRALIAADGRESTIARAVGNDFKGKTSLLLYASAVGLAFYAPYGSCAIYVLVGVMWLIPDPRIERALPGHAA
jgi:uncharacterized membrane protein